MEQILGLSIAVTLTGALLGIGHVVGRRLAARQQAGRHGRLPWDHASRLAGYASMRGPVPELEIVRLGEVLAAQVEEFLAAQATS